MPETVPLTPEQVAAVTCAMLGNVAPKEKQRDLTEEVRRLATAVEVTNERWVQQEQVNAIVAEHGRAIHGGNGDVGVVGQTARQDISTATVKAALSKWGVFYRIDHLYEASERHANRLKWVFWLAIGTAFTVITAAVGGGMIFCLGWK